MIVCYRECMECPYGIVFGDSVNAYSKVSCHLSGKEYREILNIKCERKIPDKELKEKIIEYFYKLVKENNVSLEPEKNVQKIATKFNISFENIALILKEELRKIIVSVTIINTYLVAHEESIRQWKYAVEHI